MANVGDRVMIFRRTHYEKGGTDKSLMRAMGMDPDKDQWETPVGYVVTAYPLGYRVEGMRNGCKWAWGCDEKEIAKIQTKEEQEEKKMTGTIMVGTRVKVNPITSKNILGNDCSAHWMIQSGGGEGTVIDEFKNGYPNWWQVRWDNGTINTYCGHGLEVVSHQINPGSKCPCVNCNKVKVVKEPPKPVIKLDPYQFVRWGGICSQWQGTFKTDKWEDAWKAGMAKHGGANEMCNWIKTRGGNCMCNKPYKEWRAELEKVMDVKLVDYKGLVERWTRGKRRK